MVQLEPEGAVPMILTSRIVSGGIPLRAASLACASGPPWPMVLTTPEAASAESVRPPPRLVTAPMAAAVERLFSRLRRSILGFLPMRIPRARHQKNYSASIGKRELRRNPPADHAFHAVGRELIGVNDPDCRKARCRCQPGRRRHKTTLEDESPRRR